MTSKNYSLIRDFKESRSFILAIMLSVAAILSTFVYFGTCTLTEGLLTLLVLSSWSRSSKLSEILSKLRSMNSTQADSNEKLKSIKDDLSTLKKQ